MIQPKVGLLVLLLNYILTMYPNGQTTLLPLLFKTLPHTVLPGSSSVSSDASSRFRLVTHDSVCRMEGRHSIIAPRPGFRLQWATVPNIIKLPSPLGRQPLDSNINMSVSNTTQLLGIFDLGHLLDSRVF